MINLFGMDWVLPKKWEIVSIKNITFDWRGGAPFKPIDLTEDGFPVLHKGAIQKNGNILIDSKKNTFTSEDFVCRYKNSVVNKSYLAVTLRDLVPSGPSIGLIVNLANSSSNQYGSIPSFP